MVLKELRNLVMSLDIFGEYIHLRINNQITSKTLIGGITTIIMTLGLCFMFVIMSLDIFKKGNPIVSIENRVLSESPNITLNSYSLPISFVLQDSTLNSVNDPKYFALEAYLINQNSNGNGNMISYILLELENCTLKNFPLISNKTFQESKLHNNICIKNLNSTIGGYFQESYLQYIQISLRSCVNSTESKIVCASEKEIKDFFNGNVFYFSLYFQDNIMNSQNYLNPGSPYIKNVFKIIKYEMYKECGLFLKNQLLISDNGFLFENNDETNILSYDQEYYEFSDMLSDGYLCTFNFYSSNFMEIYRRNYIKIQDVLANVGALANVFIESLKLFLSIFSSMSLYEHILNKIFDFFLIKKQITKNEKNGLRRRGIMRSRPIDKLIPHLQKSIIEENKSVNGKGTYNMNDAKNENIVTSKHYHQSPRKKSNEDIVPESIDILKFIEEQNKKNRLKFTYFEILKMYFCICCSNKDLKDKVIIYKKSLESLHDYLDISYIIQKLEELEKLKLLLLTHEQLAVFNFISKDLCTLDDKKSKENKIGKYRLFQRDKNQLANTIAKFKIRIHDEDNLSEIDKKIYDLLREDLKY